MSRLLFPRLDPARMAKPTIWQPFDVLPSRALKMVWVKSAGETNYSRRPMLVSSLHAYMTRFDTAPHMFWSEMTAEEMEREEREGNAL